MRLVRPAARIQRHQQHGHRQRLQRLRLAGCAAIELTPAALAFVLQAWPARATRPHRANVCTAPVQLVRVLAC
jgi:hypothetical protein